MSLANLVKFLNNKEKVQKQIDDKNQKHYENMKRYKYRKQQKNNIKTARSKVAQKNNISKISEKK